MTDYKSMFEQALSNLIDIASQCDSWQSFPWHALEEANEALEGKP